MKYVRTVTETALLVCLIIMIVSSSVAYGDSDSLNIDVETKEVNQSDENQNTSIGISLSQNPGFWCFRVFINYDSPLILKSVNLDDVNGFEFYPLNPEIGNPYIVAGESKQFADILYTGHFFTLNFEVPANTSPGKYDVSIYVGHSSDISNYSGETVTTVIQNSSIIVNPVYSISYSNGDGVGSVPVSQNYPNGSVVTVAGPSGLSKTGFNQIGWEDDSGIKYYGGEKYTINGKDVTFKPLWKPKEFEVTYVYNSPDIPNPTIVKQQYASKYVFPSVEPVRTGYSFDGWFTQSSGGTIIDKMSVFELLDSQTLYAHWTPIKCSIIFNETDLSVTQGNTTLHSGNTVDYDSILTIVAIEHEGHSISSIKNNETTVTGQTVKVDSVNMTLTVEYTVLSYQVEYRVDGNILKSTSVPYGSVVNLSDKYVESGYEVSDWASDDVAPIDGRFSMPAHNVVFNCVKTPVEYNVTFVTNGGDELDSLPFTILSDIDLSLTSKKGYTFAGWFKESDFRNEVKHISPGTIGSFAVYAKWNVIEYTITYKLGYNHADINDTYTIDSGKELISPEREGYDFSGWFSDASLTDVSSDRISIGTIGDVTFYAKWDLRSYKISISVNDREWGSVDRSEVIANHFESISAYGDKLSIGAEVIIASAASDSAQWHYSFKKWTYSSDTVTGTMNIIAEFGQDLRQYSVVFHDYTGKNDVSVDVLYGSDAFYPKNSNPVKPNDAEYGYSFIGWNQTRYANIADESALLDITGNRDLYPVFAKTAKQYFVEYRIDGSVEKRDQYGFGGTVTLLQQPSKVGYIISDWTTSGITVINGSFSMPSHDVVFMANSTPIQYSIRFDGTTGNGTMADQNFKYDISQKLNANNFTKTGYTFSHWESGSIQYMDEQSVCNLSHLNGEILTFKAVWVKNHYTIQFDSNGGTGSMENQSFEYDVSNTLFENKYVRIGYSFGGWTIDGKVYADMAQVSSLTSIPDGVVTATAVWSPISYTVYYNANSGIGTMSPDSFVYDTEKKLSVNTFVRDGFDFKGWSFNGNIYSDGESVKNLTTENGAKVELKAIWDVKQYTISFDTDGGSPIDSITQSYGTVVLTPVNPTKTGYTFVGWNRDIPSLMPAENIVVKAVWKINQYTVSIVGDGITVFDGNTKVVSGSKINYGTVLTFDIESKDHYTGTVKVNGAPISGSWTLVDDVSIECSYDLKNYAYSISYVDQNGTRISADYIGSAAYDSSVTPVPKSIVGYSSPSSQTIVISDNEAQNVIIYQYLIKQYSVIYKLDGKTIFEGNYSGPPS